MGGTNTLALVGYSDTQVQKMGRWQGTTFKEFIREELHSYSEGMSHSMKRKFVFVNITTGSFTGITNTVVVLAYDNLAAA